MRSAKTKWPLIAILSIGFAGLIVANRGVFLVIAKPLLLQHDQLTLSIVFYRFAGKEPFADLCDIASDRMKDARTRALAIEYLKDNYPIGMTSNVIIQSLFDSDKQIALFSELLITSDSSETEDFQSKLTVQCLSDVTTSNEQALVRKHLLFLMRSPYLSRRTPDQLSSILLVLHRSQDMLTIKHALAVIAKNPDCFSNYKDELEEMLVKRSLSEDLQEEFIYTISHFRPFSERIKKIISERSNRNLSVKLAYSIGVARVCNSTIDNKLRSILRGTDERLKCYSAFALYNISCEQKDTDSQRKAIPFMLSGLVSCDVLLRIETMNLVFRSLDRSEFIPFLVKLKRETGDDNSFVISTIEGIDSRKKDPGIDPQDIRAVIGFDGGNTVQKLN